MNPKNKSSNVQKSELDDADAALTARQTQLNEKEEEIEDLKDDVKLSKKKVEEAKKKNDELQSQLDKSEKERKQTASELDEANTALAQKKRALGFVNEILSAKDADDKSAVEIREKTEKIHNIYCDEILDFYKEDEVNQEKDRKEQENKMWQWCNQQRKTWLTGKKVVSFVGEFSAGKTSIVNRILEQGGKDAPKLPVSSKATTAIPTYISYGTDFLSQFTNPVGDLKNISKKAFESVTKEAMEQVNVSSLIQYFVMSYNNKNLKDLSILDTPGFNSNDKNDAARTAEVIKESDLLFWVLDANAGEINKSSLQIIKEYLEGLPLFIVINKADTKSPNELNKLEKHIKITIEKAGIDVRGYLRFSQKENINVLMEAINSVENKDRNENLRELYDEFIGYKDEYAKCEKEMKEMLNEPELELDNAIKKLPRLNKKILKNCTDALNLPQLETRWGGFAESVYEMDKDEYTMLLDCLIKAIDTGKELSKLGKGISIYAKRVQEIQDSYQKIRSSLTRIETADSEFIKAVMALNPDFFKNNKRK